jgi:rare lipoprotein A
MSDYAFRSGVGTCAVSPRAYALALAGLLLLTGGSDPTSADDWHAGAPDSLFTPEPFGAASAFTPPPPSIPPVPPPEAPTSREEVALVKQEVGRGIAAWYDLNNRTASGERYSAGAFTAGHRTLPFGTEVEVVNLRNGRSVRVRITDRGPFTRGRVIDLSRAAAREIGMSGVDQVALYTIVPSDVTATGALPARSR